VVVDGQHLLLSSWLGGAVQTWDPQTHQVLENYVDFAAPLNAIRFQGDLIVAELGTNSVVRTHGADPAERVTLAANLGVPVGLAASDDDLWVSDWATGMVLQLVADGEVLTEPKPVATGLAAPEGLALTSGGSLLVVESGAGRLSRIHLSTGAVMTIAEELELGAQGPPTMPPTWGFNGVAVGPSGAIYVTGDKAGVVYRIQSDSKPSATPTTATIPVTSEGMASSVADVAGIWSVANPQSGEFRLEIDPDGAFRAQSMGRSPTLYDTGKVVFEETQFRFESTGEGHPFCAPALERNGMYEVTVTKVGDKVVRLVFTLIEDACLTRKESVLFRPLERVEE
jgi:sugar lactone lactonase YvrE